MDSLSTAARLAAEAEAAAAAEADPPLPAAPIPTTMDAAGAVEDFAIAICIDMMEG